MVARHAEEVARGAEEVARGAVQVARAGPAMPAPGMAGTVAVALLASHLHC